MLLLSDVRPCRPTHGSAQRAWLVPGLPPEPASINSIFLPFTFTGWAAKGAKTQLPNSGFCFPAGPSWLQSIAFFSPLTTLEHKAQEAWGCCVAMLVKLWEPCLCDNWQSSMLGACLPRLDSKHTLLGSSHVQINEEGNFKTVIEVQNTNIKSFK